jgi:hypothetical protein
MKWSSSRPGDSRWGRDLGIDLGAWVSHQRTVYKLGQLSADRIARLEAIGFVWVGTSGPRRHR